MKRFLAKLAFIHRYIWERDALYCLSLFVGPSALLGAAAAAEAGSVGFDAAKGLRVLLAAAGSPPALTTGLRAKWLALASLDATVSSFDAMAKDPSTSAPKSRSAASLSDGTSSPASTV